LKYIKKYQEINLPDSDAVFNYLLKTLKKTIRTYDFFVAWNKVINNVSKIEIPLNILNCLIGKDNIEERFKELIIEYPEIVSVIPILIAVRDEKIKIADIGSDIDYSFAKKKKYSQEEIEKIVFFSRECGLLKIFKDKTVKNLVDYCTGIEVGIDTNARKNRSGKAMESLTEVYIKALCEKYNYQYIAQATVAKIKAEFGKEVPTDKADRHFDFAINSGADIYLIEVNYYSGGGSKLKSVAGEFSNLYSLIKTDINSHFIWITDGKGWLTAQKPLEETLQSTEYILNIKMIEDGILEDIVSKRL
jgi:type II restriction enzyme